MSDSDVQEGMQGKLTSAIDQATGSLRKEFERRLRELRKELEGQVRAAVATQVAAATPSPADAPDEDGSRVLLDAAEAIDRTRSQTQVLAALLEGADTLASRAAVLLTRPDGIQGWGAVGFDEAGPQIEEVHLPYSQGTPWCEMANARGAVTLTRKETAPLCKALGTDRPHEAVLIPIALADRTAATLYADRFGDDDRLDAYGLQILATLAGLTLETLPLRRRTATPSLRLAEEAAGEAGLPPWDPQGIAADPEPAEATPEVEPTVEASEEPIATEAVGFTVEEAPQATAPAATAADGPQAADQGYVKREVVEAAADAADSETAAKEAPEVTPDRSPPTADAAVDKPADKPAAVADKPTDKPAAATDKPTDKPAAAADEQSGATTKRAKKSRTGGSQVAPPPEVQGPGSAFSDLAAGGADQAQHEDARRLARLLVSEIKLYNEEKLEEGRRKGNITAALGDEIDQSRQAYDQRVDESVRKASDYFQDEVIRLLARGDQAALGGS